MGRETTVSVNEPCCVVILLDFHFKSDRLDRKICRTLLRLFGSSVASSHLLSYTCLSRSDHAHTHTHTHSVVSYEMYSSLNLLQEQVAHACRRSLVVGHTLVFVYP